ncbi:MAG TPA: transporter [Thermoanaerobaculaceae bacterium]|nr:transporter [Thermoanaerobaculaceae bacterium]
MLAALAAATGAVAGPPFLTDDPQPVDYRHWEAYAFSSVTATRGGTTAQFPALELNWGALPELQLHLVVPEAYAAPVGGPRASGGGDLQAGFKLRFLRESADTPQVGIFPIATLPTGDASRGLGNGALILDLPVWLQKSWGPWTTYGGGGYTINRASDGRNFASGGWLLQRDLSERLTLGAEVFASGRSSEGSPSSAVFNAGGQVNFSKQVSLLFSAGHSFSGARQRIAYIALYVTGGPGSP